MKKKTSKLLILGACAAMLTAGAAVALSNGAFKVIPNAAVGETGSYSMTFAASSSNKTVKADDGTNSAKQSVFKYTQALTSTSGNPFYMIARKGAMLTSSDLSTYIAYPEYDSVNPEASAVYFFKDSAGTEQVKFQNVTKFELTSETAKTYNIQTSDDGENWITSYTFGTVFDANPKKSVSITDKYVRIVINTDGSSRWKTFKISYSCDNNL